MKKILISGAGSYIGTSLAGFLAQWPRDYQVDTLDVIGEGWKSADITGYDAVFHVAGIAHQKETEENRHLYFEVNRDLAVAMAQKAKDAGIPQFIFMSTMSVYGMESGVITPDTRPQPRNSYGLSKWEAEEAMGALVCDTFRVAVLRPPMVYGKNCRGNFQTMKKLVEKSPVFPAVKNRRSMVSIHNLCSFVRLAVDEQLSGVFFPQNAEPVSTTEMARILARTLGRRVWFSRAAGLAVTMLATVYPTARKAFSSLTYEGCEQHGFRYCVEDLDTSVRRSV